MTANESCTACGHNDMKLLSAPRPQYVDQCRNCGSVFFHFGGDQVLSHNDQYNEDANYQRYLEMSNEPSIERRHDEALTRIRNLVTAHEEPRVFDVGAGGGDFLARAKNAGFVVAGNEVSEPAIKECRVRHGVELTLSDDLEAIARTSDGYDAVTMWCVLAHVDAPKDLLRGCRALLRPGGVLFLTTPRYCSIDRAAAFSSRMTNGHVRRVFDRRINHFHRRQYTAKGMQALLRREGFEPISITPAIGYGLNMDEYLKSLKVPALLAQFGGRLLERSREANILPRNILNVYARATAQRPNSQSL
ncbi:methyltransferase domain-containing protein [Mycolicibacterium sp. 3033]|nr:methyltransferase domain-containing protein [Mycolicibacterium aurantiacum]